MPKLKSLSIWAILSFVKNITHSFSHSDNVSLKSFFIVIPTELFVGPDVVNESYKKIKHACNYLTV